MDGMNDIMAADLALQEKRLQDIKSWGSPDFLIAEENDVIALIEKQMENKK